MPAGEADASAHIPSRKGYNFSLNKFEPVVPVGQKEILTWLGDGS
jgi:hypothetical protein